MAESSQGERVLLVAADERQRERVAAAAARDGLGAIEAATGEQALAVSRRLKPEVVVADVRLDGMSGYELCHALRREFGDRVAIVLVHEKASHPQERVAALLVGADEYIVKPVDEWELAARLRRIVARAAAGNENGPPELTPREREVLVLLADGRSRSEIAADLVISPKTVATHVRHILDKLGARTRTQAVAMAVRANMIPTPADAAQPSR